MTDVETIHDRVFNINRILQKYFFLNYKPTPEILRKKGENYIKKIENCLISGEFNTLTIYALQQLKPFLEDQEMGKTSSFLIVDSLNFFYEYYFGYDKFLEEKTKKLEKLKDLFNKFYPNIRIIFVCQEHNEFFKDLSLLNANKFIYLEVNEAIPSQSEIDDLLLMYLYFYLNVIQNVNCYLLSFDKYRWLKEYSQTEVDDAFFPEQPKIYRKLQEEIDFYDKNRRNTIDLIMENHKNFIDKQPSTKPFIGRQLTRIPMTINILKRKTYGKAVKKTGKKAVKIKPKPKKQRTKPKLKKQRTRTKHIPKKQTTRAKPKK